MNKSTLPVGIKTMIGWKNKGTLTFDNPIQRSGSQWTLLQKSLLIHSILMGYPIPNCYFLKTKDENGNTVYDCLDAKQRLTSVFDFVEGEYELHSATPPCTVDGFEFDLANLSFEELADDLKDEILGCRMSIFCLEDCTDEEVEEIFARLNNSTPLSPIQKCRSIMSTELARWTKEICSMDFFQHSIGLTVAQLRREADLEVLLQSMLLLDSRHEGYDEWKGISTAEVTKYCKHIRGKYNDDKKLMIMELFEYLGKAFREQHKFLKKSNIPMVVVLSKLALENDIKPEKFKVFIDSFSNSVCVDYEENTGSGNVKRVKTEGRLSAIAKAFADYFDLENANILSVEKNADFDDVPTSENENSEVDDVTASTDEDTPAMGSFMNDPTEEAVDTEDVVIKSNNNVTFTFAKGTMSSVDGKTEYDFSTSINSAYADTMPSYITKDNFVSQINFNYSGKLPATANIRFYAGTEYAGQTLYYSLMNADNTFAEVQAVVVDADGYMTVKQDHCSSYVVTKTEPKLPSNDDTKTDDGNNSNNGGSSDNGNTSNNGNASASDNNTSSGNTTVSTDNNTSSANTTATSPKTGDMTPIAIYVVIAVAAMGVIVFVKRRKTA